MSEFFRETRIKATRKEHHCYSCENKIAAGLPAAYMAMKQDGELWTAHSHIECREAEVAWNSETDQWGDEFCALWEIRESDDANDWLAWLRENHPIAAGRVLS